MSFWVRIDSGVRIEGCRVEGCVAGVWSMSDVCEESDGWFVILVVRLRMDVCGCGWACGALSSEETGCKFEGVLLASKGVW